MKKLAVALMMVAFVAACGEEDPPRRKSTPCTTGTQTCSGDVVQVCNNGTWTTQVNCATSGASCVTAGTTASCQGGSCTTGNQQCSGTWLQVCSGGNWTNQVNCADTGATCAVTSATAASCQGGGSNACTDASSSEYYVCDGTALIACSGTTGEQWYDCADVFDDGTVSGDCLDYGGVWGGDCIMPLGSPCFFPMDDWTLIFACGSGSISTSMGCDYIDGCVSMTTGSCTPAEEFTRYCDSNRLVDLCVTLGNYNLPLLLNCGSADVGSGTCVADHCEHSTSGGLCNDDSVQCVAPLTCQNKDANGWGTCL